MSSTLIALYLGRDLVGRCDVNCWGGTDARCECVCGTLNHGVGLERAIEQTRSMVALWLDEYRERGHVFDGVEFGIHVVHDGLFPLGEVMPLRGADLHDQSEVRALAG